MDLTPRDIQEQVFKSKFRGFDPEEVDLFLEEVAEKLHNLIQENERLREQVAQLEKIRLEFKGQEQEIRSALVTARQAAELIINQAHREAEQLRAQAGRDNSPQNPAPSLGQPQMPPPEEDPGDLYQKIALTPELIPVAAPEEKGPGPRPVADRPGLVPDFGFGEPFPGPAITFGDNEENNE